jgi:hypothetical protein
MSDILRRSRHRRRTLRLATAPRRNYNSECPPSTKPRSCLLIPPDKKTALSQHAEQETTKIDT